MSKRAKQRIAAIAGQDDDGPPRRKKASKPKNESELLRIYESMPLCAVMHGKGAVATLFDSHTEELYFRQRVADKQAGLIKEVFFKPCRLKISPSTFYEPDSLVLENDNTLTFEEIKGSKRNKLTGECQPYSRPVGWIKVKLAASLHPFRFRLVWWDKSAKVWLKREVA